MTGEVAELVSRAREGDRVAFDELVRRTHVETYTLAFRLTGNADDAADVVQDAYLRAYRSIERFRGDSEFSTWLYRITANCASTQLSKRIRNRHDELNDEAIPEADPRLGPEARADVVFARRDITTALAKLPVSLRTVVVLRDIYDLPHDAIAKELGITEVAAKVRLHRARKRLREALMPRLGKEDDVRTG